MEDVAEGRVENPAPVVGIGAICQIRSGTPTSRSQSFSVAEFVDLEDGRRVILHRDRGWSQGYVSTDPDDQSWPATTVADLIDSVLVVVLPDDDDSPEDHEWSGLARLAQARGLDVTADQLRELEYEVVLAPELLAWLHGHQRAEALDC